MNNIVEKIGSYQIFTNLFPGGFFVLGLRFFFNLEFPTKNIGEDLMVYYFIGLIISRIGSLIIEPALKKIRFLKFAPYCDFVVASKIDAKVDTLSEINNYMRSLLTCSLLFLAVGGLQRLVRTCYFFSIAWKWGLLILVLIIFLFSYKKQTNYVRKRVETNLPSEQ